LRTRGGAAGRRGLVIDHEGEGPRLRLAGEKLGIIRQGLDDARQRRHLEIAEMILLRHLHGLYLQHPAVGT
jgi:hypothetical protein